VSRHIHTEYETKYYRWFDNDSIANNMLGILNVLKLKEGILNVFKLKELNFDT